MVQLYFGLALWNDEGFMDFDDHFFRTFFVVAENRAVAFDRIVSIFKQEFGQPPERVCLREISEVDGYKIILAAKAGKDEQ